MNKLFYTLDKNGKEVLRDLAEENKAFTREGYFDGLFDANNYQYYENFHHYVYDDLGCDYERYGCYIRDGDKVLDIGANIGIFAHRAETRGASKVVCFEPLSLTYKCLKKNAGQNTYTFNCALGGENTSRYFVVHTDYTHIGGCTEMDESKFRDKYIVYGETCKVSDINETIERFGSFDFMKVDTEGAEVEIFKSITDDNLSKMRCVAAELHIHNGLHDFVDYLGNRLGSLGYKSFMLTHSNSGLMTANFWKE